LRDFARYWFREQSLINFIKGFDLLLLTLLGRNLIHENMIKYAFALLFLFLGIFSAQGQYSSEYPDSMSLDNLSRSEIRQYLLTLDEDSQVFLLAEKSYGHASLSGLYYGLGTALLAGALGSSLLYRSIQENSRGSLSEVPPLSEVLPYVSGTFLFGGAISLIAGTVQSQKAQVKLDKAILLYGRP